MSDMKSFFPLAAAAAAVSILEEEKEEKEEIGLKDRLSLGLILILSRCVQTSFL
jgi:hypothetical protein